MSGQTWEWKGHRRDEATSNEEERKWPKDKSWDRNSDWQYPPEQQDWWNKSSYNKSSKSQWQSGNSYWTGDDNSSNASNNAWPPASTSTGPEAKAQDKAQGKARAKEKRDQITKAAKEGGAGGRTQASSEETAAAGVIASKAELIPELDAAYPEPFACAVEEGDENCLKALPDKVPCITFVAPPLSPSGL